MTTRDRPDPPAALDRTAREILADLEDRDAETLHAASQYLDDLSTWKEAQSEADRNADTETGSTVDEEDEMGDGDHEYPSNVPERASVTVKKIAGTTYHYYQWRDGDRIESKTVER